MKKSSTAWFIPKIWMSCFFLCFLLPQLAQAQNSSFEKKLNLALAHIENHKSFQVEFQQEAYSAMRDKTSLSQGILKIQAPKSWLFEVQKPRSEIYMSNGKDFWKYVPDLKHAQHLKGNSLDLDYLSLLTNPKSIRKIYTISPWPTSEPHPAENAEDVSIKLERREDNSQKVLYAILNVRKGFVEELRVVQSNGNRVRLLFSNNTDQKFNEKTFSFVPPEGIVIDSN